MDKSEIILGVPDKESQNKKNSNTPPGNNKRRKRKNKNKKHNKNLGVRKKIVKHKTSFGNSASKVAITTMSAWAENYTFAATWQLKHQLAYWKAKAKSLEYENSVLHDIIRKGHQVETKENTVASTSKTSEYSSEAVEDNGSNNNSINRQVIEPKHQGKSEVIQNMEEEDSQSEEHSSGEDSDEIGLQVSEEYIQFLMVNAKHKQEVRLERERLKALEEAAEQAQREQKLKSRRHYGLTAKELYGDKWQKINALEMSMKSTFMSNVDSEKPAHWPVIPFNFDFS